MEKNDVSKNIQKKEYPPKVEDLFIEGKKKIKTNDKLSLFYFELCLCHPDLNLNSKLENLAYISYYHFKNKELEECDDIFQKLKKIKVQNVLKNNKNVLKIIYRYAKLLNEYKEYEKANYVINTYFSKDCNKIEGENEKLFLALIENINLANNKAQKENKKDQTKNGNNKGKNREKNESDLKNLTNTNNNSIKGNYNKSNEQQNNLTDKNQQKRENNNRNIETQTKNEMVKNNTRRNLQNNKKANRAKSTFPIQNNDYLNSKVIPKEKKEIKSLLKGLKIEMEAKNEINSFKVKLFILNRRNGHLITKKSLNITKELLQKFFIEVEDLKIIQINEKDKDKRKNFIFLFLLRYFTPFFDLKEFNKNEIEEIYPNNIKYGEEIKEKMYFILYQDNLKVVKQYNNLEISVKPFGLSNLGNTCYLNSGLQCIIHCDILSQYFIHFFDSNKEKNSLPKKYKSFLLNYNNQEYLKEVRFSFVKIETKFNDFRQHDSLEFMTDFLNALSKGLNRDEEASSFIEIFGKDDKEKNWIHLLKNEYSIIHELFYMQVHHSYECKCGTKKSLYEPFLILFLPIPDNKNKTTLFDCFNLFSTKNNIKCQKCSKNQKKRTSKISIFPYYLIIMFKRFQIIEIGGKKNQKKIVKKNTDITFKTSIELSAYFDKKIKENYTNYHYDLICVNYHSGSTDGGHYTARCKVDTNWYFFSDTSTYNDREKDPHYRNAYVLIYKRKI